MWHVKCKDSMRTQFELCNLALNHIGMRKIGSLDGTDPSAVACTNFFEPCRDDVFREFQWPFCTVQQTLNQSIITVPLGWTYCYDYPVSNTAGVWYVFNDATAKQKHLQDFEVLYDPESGTRIIGSDLDGAYAEMTYIVTNTLLWDAKFDMAMSYRLAATICPILTGDNDKALKIMNLYMAMINEAKRIAAVEKLKKPDRTSDAIDAR